jgi:hypothetical protein
VRVEIGEHRRHHGGDPRAGIRRQPIRREATGCPPFGARLLQDEVAQPAQVAPFEESMGFSMLPPVLMSPGPK